MTFLANVLNTSGLVLLTHAIYSSHEHTSSSSSTSHLPADITLELLLSTLLLCVGIVLATAPLRPIRWNEWAGQIEGTKIDERSRERGVYGNPFEGLEFRSSFLDVRRERKGFEKWMKGKK